MAFEDTETSSKVSEDTAEVLDIEAAEAEGDPKPANPEETLQQKHDALQEANLRLLAEMENMRKRTQREKQEAHTFGTTRLLKELLPVIDNFDRALGAGTADKDLDAKAAGGVLDGLKMIESALATFLKNQGVEKVGQVGEAFDPEKHEAMREESAADGQEPGQIVSVLQPGYILNGRLLRAALVAVSK